jgi:hypothetical protein
MERTSAPVRASQTFAVLSNEAVAMRLPSGLKATATTKPWCPLRERIS